MSLTATAVKNAKPKAKPYSLPDSGSLSLHVLPNGTKTWRYRFRWHGKQQIYTIGKFPSVTLAEARNERYKACKLIAAGIHPTRHKKAERARQKAEEANTFEAVAREWINKKKPGWSPTYLRQIEDVMAADVFPVVGALPIREVSAAQLLGILESVEGRGAETVALLIRQWCSAIFRYAVATLRADFDVAAALQGAVHRPKVQHHKPLDRAEIPGFLKNLSQFSGYRATAISLHLLLYVFTRPGELRQAKWSEFDLDGAEWRIPSERMKMREQHIVPLSQQAVELLRELRKLTGEGEHGWLFPNSRRPSTCMTPTTMNRALERLGYQGKFSAHGFRSTASTILNEQGWPADVIERQLAHAPRNKVRASYNQAQYLDERSKMMQTWSDFVDSLSGDSKVVSIKEKRA